MESQRGSNIAEFATSQWGIYASIWTRHNTWTAPEEGASIVILLDSTATHNSLIDCAARVMGNLL